jgi:hypothetical protein
MQNQRFSKALNSIFNPKDFEPPHLPNIAFIIAAVALVYMGLCDWLQCFKKNAQTEDLFRWYKQG